MRCPQRNLESQLDEQVGAKLAAPAARWVGGLVVHVRFYEQAAPAARIQQAAHAGEEGLRVRLSLGLPELGGGDHVDVVLEQHSIA